MPLRANTAYSSSRKGLNSYTLEALRMRRTSNYKCRSKPSDGSIAQGGCTQKDEAPVDICFHSSHRILFYDRFLPSGAKSSRCDPETSRASHQASSYRCLPQVSCRSSHGQKRNLPNDMVTKELYLVHSTS